MPPVWVKYGLRLVEVIHTPSTRDLFAAGVNDSGRLLSCYNQIKVGQ